MILQSLSKILLLSKVKLKEYQNYLSSKCDLIPLRGDTQYLSLGDFGMCEFTYLLLTKLRPKRPKTNHKCQRCCVFVFVIVQVRIFQKSHKNPRKPTKTSTGMEPLVDAHIVDVQHFSNRLTDVQIRGILSLVEKFKSRREDERKKAPTCWVSII